MFEHDHSTRAQPTDVDSNATSADYLESLHRALGAMCSVPRETRLQRERLSSRFARKVRVGLLDEKEGMSATKAGQTID